MTQSDALKALLSGSNVFLTGEPGAGKTYTVNQFIEQLRMNDIPYAVTASTGIAATHINGQTIHAWSGIGIRDKITDGVLATLESNDFTMQRVNRARVLIIDEVSMLDALFIDNLDLVLKHLRGDSRPFGGLQVVFVGDFFQLPPVVKGRETRFAFEADAWNAATPRICYLTEQHRQSDGEFLDILTAMRLGTVTEAHKARLRAAQLPHEPETVLYTHNSDVDRENERELAKLEGEERSFVMRSGGIPFLVERLKKNCLAPEKLTLKVGAVVMFVRNNWEVGYVNGTIGHVTAFEDGYPIIVTKAGKRIRPELEEWAFDENGQQKAYIQQIPLRLAWAITVHKSQGMSLDEASVDLSRCFEYGQGYVAISRVRTLEGLHLGGINPKAFHMHPKVVAKDAEFRAAGV